MKKNKITILMLTAMLGLSVSTYAQEARVGINTTTPKTTLDVNGKTDTSGNLLTTDVTGLQAPRLTRAELTAKGNTLYGADQKGALVYITDISAGDVLSQRVNITATGYYYFDGTVWQKVGSGSGVSTAWIPGGNTNGSLKTIGTNDNYDLPMVVGATEAMRILQGTIQPNTNGNIVIGTTLSAPVASGTSNTTAAQKLARLTVVGADAAINGITVGKGGNPGAINQTTAVGEKALFNATAGADYNSGIGAFSLTNNTTGARNTGVGSNALGGNTTGSQNTAVGSNILSVNTTGSNNAAIGYSAGSSLVNGNRNTFIGNLAGSSSTTGDNNIALGYNQLLANITGSNQLNIGGAIFGTGITGSATAPAGNIGIGTTAPGNKLEVKSDTAGTSGLRFTNLTSTATTAANPGTGVLSVNSTGDVIYVPGGGAAAAADWYVNGTTTAAGNADNQFILGSASVGQNSSATVASATSGSTAAQQLAKLTVANGDASINGITAGKGGGQVANNTAVGNTALFNNTTGNSNTAIGSFALLNNTTASSNVAIGNAALYNNTDGGRNVAVGNSSLRTFVNTASSNNTGLGDSTLDVMQTGFYNTAVGSDAGGSLVTGNRNIYLGYQTGFGHTSGNNNIGIGNQQSFPNLTGSNQLNIGGAIFGTGITGSVAAPAGNIGIGTTAPGNKLEVKSDTAGTSGLRFTNLTSTATTAANPGTGVLSVNSTGDVIYVPGGGAATAADWYVNGTTTAAGNADNQFILGSASVGQNSSATVASATSGSTAAQQLAKLTVANGDASINGITAGKGGGQVATNTAFGANALSNSLTTSADNTAIGQYAINFNTSGVQNTAIGSQALAWNTTGSDNVAIGSRAMHGGANITGGTNIAIGNVSMNNISTGQRNVGLGYRSLNTITSGNGNIAIGHSAADNQTTGDKNIIIGDAQKAANNTGSNQLNIGGAIFGTGLTGSAAAPAGNIGIGTTAPGTRLEINNGNIAGAIKIVDGTQGMGKVLTSDSNGQGTWQQPGISNVYGTLGSGASITDFNLATYVNASITLPPGKWAVSAGSSTRFNGTLTAIGSVWVIMFLSDSPTSGNYTNDYYAAASGAFLGGKAFSTGISIDFMSGTQIIENNTAGNKTYYLYVRPAEINGSFSYGNFPGENYITDVFSSTNYERYFYAVKLQ